MGFLRRLFGGQAAPATERPASGLRPGSEAQSGRSATEKPPPDRPRIDRRGPLAPGCKKVIQGPPLEVVGESFHRDAIEAFLGISPDGHSAIVDAVLALEPSNPFDPHAVAVSVGGRVVGYLAKADAAAWRPVLAWYAERGITPVARGDVLGGWRKNDGTWADFGITLHVASPDTLAERQGSGKEG